MPALIRDATPARALSIFAAAREWPDRLALVDGECAFTFAELAARTAPLARTLAHARPAALALSPRATLDDLLWLYAAFACGVPVLLLHTRSAPGERARMSALCGAALPEDILPGNRHGAASAFPGDAEGDPDTTVDGEAALAYIPTSGSTGVARVVRLSRRAVLASADASARNLGWEDDDRWLLCLPLAHTGGLSIVIRTLIARRAMVLFEPGDAGLLEQAPALRAALCECDVTLVSLVPTVFDRLLDIGFRPARTLRGVLVGGAGCSPALAARAHAARIPLLTSYGLTETASQVVTRPYAQRYQALPVHAGCVSSGHALDGVELRLDAAGRIAVRTPSLFSGYVGEEAGPHDAAGWLLTTDLGFVDADGALFVRGRCDDVIVTAGENVDPLEVEAALRDLPDVAGACVFGVASERYGQVVAALIVTDDARLADAQVLAGCLHARLARHKLPRRILRVPALPLTASGKVDRRACAALFTQSTRDEALPLRVEQTDAGDGKMGRDEAGEGRCRK